MHMNFGIDVINQIKAENPGLWTAEFQAEITQMLREATELEIRYAHDTMPRGVLGLNANMFNEYMKFICNRRCNQIGLDALYPGATNPFPWMSEVMNLKKEKNFFEARVTEYQVGSLSWDSGLRVTGCCVINSIPWLWLSESLRTRETTGFLRWFFCVAAIPYGTLSVLSGALNFRSGRWCGTRPARVAGFGFASHLASPAHSLTAAGKRHLEDREIAVLQHWNSDSQHAAGLQLANKGLRVLPRKVHSQQR